MLKIKDGIDLKELEKEGYKRDDNLAYNQYTKIFYSTGKDYITNIISIDIISRVICGLEIGDYSDSEFDELCFVVPKEKIRELIKPLIEKGLVERIEE